ncbi:MAG: hypothetical protein ACRCW1_10820, partial [Anaerotignaceae bacterium]
MKNLTVAQLRKIHILAKERGLDNEMLHAHIFNLTQKDSIKALSVAEAIKVIDGLEDRGNRITFKQQRYIEGLA